MQCPDSAPHRQLCNSSGTQNIGFSKWIILLSLKKKNYSHGYFESENTLTKEGSFIPPAERVEKFWKHMMRLKEEINMQTKKQK